MPIACLNAVRGRHTPLLGSALRDDASDWQGLPDGRLLLDSKRWQAIIASRPQLRTILQNGELVTITNKNGNADDSDSAQVSVVVQNLITACPYKRIEHLPECEIRAAMLALKPTLRPGVSLDQYRVDGDVLIERYQPKNYTPRATRALGRRQDVIKRPVGRPTHAPEVRRFYLFLQECIVNDTPITRAALGEEFGVHMRTVATYLDDLQRDGLISWVRKSRGLVISFVSSDVIEIIEAPAATQPTTVAEIEASAAAHEETEIKRDGCVSSDRAEADHITLPAAIAEALDALPGERANEKTGELRPWPRSVKRVMAWLAEHYPMATYGSEHALRLVLADERERRQRREMLEALGQLTRRGLKAQLRLAEFKYDQAEALGSNASRWWYAYRDKIRAEMQSRPVDPEKPKRQRQVCEALPDLRAAGGRHQAELWERAEDALLTLRAQRQGAR